MGKESATEPDTYSMIGCGPLESWVASCLLAVLKNLGSQTQISARLSIFLFEYARKDFTFSTLKVVHERTPRYVVLSCRQHYIVQDRYAFILPSWLKT